MAGRDRSSHTMGDLAAGPIMSTRLSENGLFGDHTSELGKPLENAPLARLPENCAHWCSGPDAGEPGAANNQARSSSGGFSN